MKANHTRKTMMAAFGTQDADRTVAPVTPAATVWKAATT
jgi:hypothetical protein